MNQSQIYVPIVGTVEVCLGFARVACGQLTPDNLTQCKLLKVRAFRLSEVIAQRHTEIV